MDELQTSKPTIVTASAEHGIQVDDEIVKYITPLLRVEPADKESTWELSAEASQTEESVAQAAAAAVVAAAASRSLALKKDVVDIETAERLNVQRSVADGGDWIASTSWKRETDALDSAKAHKLTSEDDDQDALDVTDAFASAWQHCQAEGRSWGGRGFGGRGVVRRYQCLSSASRDVLVDGVTLAFAGKELLQRAELRLMSGRRYVLLGRNGVGKSSLLRRIATGSLPGFPPHLRVGFLVQEDPELGDETRTAVEALVEGACRRRRITLETERDALEASLEEENQDALVERLCEVEDELSELVDGKAICRAKAALGRVCFDESRASTPMGHLSGGWRMRLQLAALLLEKCDLLLLDEPTNHLDLKGVLWLERLLVDELDRREATSPTVLCVSHDRAFVEAIATDIIVFDEKQLSYFGGGFAAFEQTQQERAMAEQHRLDASTRQEIGARSAAEKTRQRAIHKKGTNDNALRQAKQRLAKIERIGLHREDGKRYKTHSLAALEEAALRVPTKVEARRAIKTEKFEVPQPSNLGIGDLLALDEVDVGYCGEPLVQKVVAQLGPGSRVAVVGDNGSGKTTLLKVLAGQLPPLNQGGRIWRKPKAKVVLVRQDHAELLVATAEPNATAVSYLSQRFHVSDLVARSKLGKFGVAHVAALPLRKLSGGQKARLSLAVLTWQSPHVMLLDEPTNHLDLPALDALAASLQGYPGAVVVVSHNRAFLSACCNELWEISSRQLHVNREADFNELFAEYADRVLHAGGTGGLSGVAASLTDARVVRKANALVSSSRSARTRKSASKKACAAGGAANRTALI